MVKIAGYSTSKQLVLPRGVIASASALAEMERCKACGDGVPVSSSRRILNTSTSDTQRNAIVAISNTIDFPEPLVHFGSGYLCKKCFQLAGRYEHLKSELSGVEGQLKNNLLFVLNNHTDGVARAAKRPSSGETIPRPVSYTHLRAHETLR